MLALPSQELDRLLIYFDGYVNGMSKPDHLGERIEGDMINRVMAECKTSPASFLLDVFTRASRQ